MSHQALTVQETPTAEEVLSFCAAAEKNDFAAVTAYLTKFGSAAVNAPCTKRGNTTALNWAVWDGNVEMVQLLLEHDADPHHKSTNNFTPQRLAEHWAKKSTCKPGHPVILDLLNAEEKNAPLRAERRQTEKLLRQVKAQHKKIKFKRK